MVELIRQVMGWTAVHHHLAGLLIALVAFSESLAFIGLIIPGEIMMFGAGALISAGALAFWPTLGWAILGAIGGDGASYWLGRHYGGQIRRMRPFSTHPRLLSRGEAFFKHHGGKSVLLGRFIGPMRPVVPVVAGMLHMSPGRFFVTNVISALGWGPAFLLPGMAVGASLALAGEVGTRLALLLGALLAAGWLLVALIRVLYRYLAPRLSQFAAAALKWGRRHPHTAGVLADVLDPARPQSWSLLVWVALLIGATWVFFGVLQDVLSRDPLVYAGVQIYRFLQTIRTPAGDYAMVILTELGDAVVLLPVALVAAVWLLWKGSGRDALYLIAAIAFGLLAVLALKAILHLPRPVELYAGVEVFSFPSGHAVMSTVTYGFLAVLVAPSFPPPWRWLPYAGSALLVGGIAFSRLYLGAHWLSDVIAGAALGVAWVALLTLARERGQQEAAPVPGLIPVLVLAWLAVTAWHVSGSLPHDLQRYAVHRTTQRLAERQWWAGGWQQLPLFRRDLEGEREQPLNLQWVGPLRLLRQRLSARGWHEPVAATPRSALRWLLPHPKLKQLPVLPQLHDGRYEALRLVLDDHHIVPKSRQLILRLWPTEVRLTPGDRPLWVGTVALQRVQRLPLVSFPVTTGQFDQAMALFRTSLPSLQAKSVRASPPSAGKGEGAQRLRWNGEVLLLRRDR